MADRLFAGAILLIVIGYTAIAFTGIKAPFQYDPLGPESWPQMLGLVSLATLGYIMVRPAVGRIDVNRATLFRLGIVVLFLIAYARLFQPLGFLLATALFCLAMTMLLGSRILPSLLFGAAAGIGAYLLCSVVLDLSLPAGVLEPLL